jgi:thioesterase domain-containing protein
LLDAPDIERLAVRFGEVPEAAGASAGESLGAGDEPSVGSTDQPKGKYDDLVMPESDVYVLPPEEDAAAFSSLVPLKPSGSRTPFFVIHARGGAVLNYQPLTKFVDAEQPIYGLQSQGLDGVTEPLRSIEAMAAHYITLVRSIQPHGPYLLGGGSLGGVIALEMAHQLRTIGEETSLLAMFDSWGPNVFMDTQRQNAVQHVGSKYNRIVRLVRERGVPRMLRQVYRRGMEFADEAGNAAVVRWHRVLQRVARRPLPHAVRYQFVERVNLAVLRVYRPQPWDGEVVLFRALDDPDFSKDDPSMGWSGTALGGIKLIDCPGTHNTIMKGPIFGAYLSQEIRRAQLGASAG